MDMSYKRQTDVFASYFAYIKSFRQKFPAAYPLMIYAYKCGDVVVFEILQSFDNPSYAENFLKVVNEL